MCTYLAKRGATYYFRRLIPTELRPVMDGRTEFMVSLRTKDREAAKRLIPAHTIASDKELAAARVRLASGPENASQRPLRPVDHFRAARERAEADWQDENAAYWEAKADRREAREHYRAQWEEELSGSTARMSPRMAALKDILRDRDFDLAVANDRLLKADIDAASLDASAAEAGPSNRLEGQHKNFRPLSGSGATTDAVWLDTTVVDRWAAERQVKAKTKDAHVAVARWFYERAGRVPVGQITRRHVITFKDKLLEEGQSAQNINTKLSRLKTLLGFAVQNDFAENNAAHGMNIVGAAAAPRKRQPFDLSDLKAIFGSPIYAVDARPTRGRGEAGYWLPLLALFSGARMEELGQLRPSDVQKLTYLDADGIEHASWFLRVTTLADEGEAANQLKNEESERLVPVHPELERLGFVAYAERMGKAGHARIFHELRPGAYGRLTAKWGEWFGFYLRAVCRVADKRKVFHSFRHTFKDMARHCGMEEGVQRQIMGHSGEDVADDYGKGHSLYRVVEGMSRYRIAGLTLPKRGPG